MKSGRYAIVVIAASAGGVQALQKVLSALPRDFPLPIAVVQHRSSQAPNLLARVLGRHTPLTVKLAAPGETVCAGTVYLAGARERPQDPPCALIGEPAVRFRR